LGDPHEAGLLEDVPEGADGTLLEGGEGKVGDDTLRLDELSCLNDFLVSLGREGDVNPSGEFVFKIPGGFAVTNKDKGVLVRGLECREAVLVR